MRKTIPTRKLIQYAVAFVFITSGMMKLFSTGLGEVFIHLGIPYPLTVMQLLAVVEIICGILLILEKYTKQAALVLIAVMIAAVILTKIPALHQGFIHALFQSRLDVVMLVLLYILYRRQLQDIRTKNR